MTAEAKATPPLCTRCKEQDGVLDLRSDTVCETCFTTFVASKAIKRLEVLQRETRGPRLPSRPQRYLLALSRRPSSTALLHILNENVRRQRERNQRLKFELVPVFVDVDVVNAADTATSSSPSSSDPIFKSPDALEKTISSTDAFTAHFPELTIHKFQLSSILSSREIDWTSLPPQDPALPPSQRLTDLFTNLPTASARADVSRLLVRHALFAAAATHDCGVVLLGYNTTSLAELTLSEAAKGRGFGIPWLVNDGAFPLPRAIADDHHPAPTDLTSSPSQINGGGGSGAGTMIQIYSPLREIFRKEILTYLSIVSSAAAGRPLAELFPAASAAPSHATTAVVSHRDLSLDDVVARFFADAEASYPSVVANVVRTTGKLNRTGLGGRQCGLCGVGLDPLGDERWKGEIGEADATDDNGDERPVRKSMLCYGCERSVKG